MDINKSILYIILAVLSFGVYANSLDNEFVFDDESVIVGYTPLQELSSIPKFFTAEEGFHQVIGRYYRPVVSTTYAVDFAIWGLKPSGFHLTNILIHTVTTLLLLSILLKLFGEYEYGQISSFIGALIFAVHPIHTEAVSWVSGRTDSLVTLFLFLSLLFYIKYRESENNKYLFVSLSAYALALLSKEMAVTFPVIIFLFDFIYRKKDIEWIKKNILSYVYFAGLTIVFVMIRFYVLRDVVDRTNYLYFSGKDGMTVFYTMIQTIPVYFRLLFYPVNLLYHYNGVMPDSSSITDIRTLLSLIFLVVLTFVAVITYKNQNVISFSIIFFQISLLPVMNIVPTMNFMAERFLYITSFLISLLTAYYFSKYINGKNRKLFFVLSAAVIFIFGYLTFQRNADWRTNDTLYSTAEGRDGSVLLVNAGNIYANKQNYSEAEKRYKRAIEIRDNSVLAHHNLGLIYLIRGSLDSAEMQIEKGLAIDSLAPDGYLQLANIYQQQGRISEAIAILEKLQMISPNYRNSADLLANIKMRIKSDQTGPGKEGEVKPNNSFLENRSLQYYKTQQFELAIKDLEELIRINPDLSSGYYNNIALCYEGMKQTAKAKEFYQKAFDTDKENVNSIAGLANIYLQENNRKEALKYYNLVLQADPTNLNVKRKTDSLKALK
jgi:protein O-mannosyl-transferase